MRNDFYICHKKFDENLGKSIDWFIKSWSFPNGSDEWKLCRLKQRIANKKAMGFLNKAREELYV